MHLKRYLFFILIAYSITGLSQPVITIDSAGKIQKIGKLLYLYEDKSAALTLEQISSPEYLTQFKKSEYELPSYNVTKSAIWVHLKIVNHSGTNACLLIDPPNLRDIRLYQRHPRHFFKERKTGYLTPVESREVKSNHFLFNLDSSRDTVEYFIRFSNVEPLQLDLKVGNMGEFIDGIQIEDMINCYGFGLMLMMMIYNLYLHFTNQRDRVYIYYVLYVLFSMLFISFFAGYFVYFPQWFLSFMSHRAAIIPALSGIFGVLFAIHFLETKKYAGIIHYLMLSLIFLVIVDIIINLAGFESGSIIFIQLLGLVFGLLSVLTGVVVLRKGYKPAKYYLMGVGIYMAGLAIFIFIDLHILPFNSFTVHALQLSSSIEVIMLSFALGDKMNVFQKEKNSAKEEALRVSMENEKLVREQNVELERKVKERTHEIHLQKEIIEEKNKDIVSSIEYAKRIQRALLASDALLNKSLPDHFVFYMPKDIVSGDFYWAQQTKENKFLMCTADCTGHGVPGAFMSLLNISFLNEATVERKIISPDLILNEVRSKIIQALNPTGDEQGGKDGMDCSLCLFDFENKQLHFSCANNPLWIIRDGNVIESEVDKFPVGQQSDVHKPFTLQTMNLQKDDIVYTFTDGFADQFGGPKGKKFKYKQLRDLILANSMLPLQQQKSILEKTIVEWKGNLEQIDDILVIGIKI